MNVQLYSTKLQSHLNEWNTLRFMYHWNKVPLRKSIPTNSSDFLAQLYMVDYKRIDVFTVFRFVHKTLLLNLVFFQVRNYKNVRIY